MSQVTLRSSDNVDLVVGKLLICFHPAPNLYVGSATLNPVAHSSLKCGGCLTCRIEADESVPSDKDVAEKSVLIRNLLEDMGEETTSSEAIPIPNVSTTSPNTLQLC